MNSFRDELNRFFIKFTIIEHFITTSDETCERAFKSFEGRTIIKHVSTISNIRKVIGKSFERRTIIEHVIGISKRVQRIGSKDG